jgi:uncharacterized protein YutE (UPF0331/DUF86 family)
VQTRITKLEQRRSAGNVAWFAGERKVRSELASFALADFRVQLCVDLALHQISMANETAPATMGAAFDSLAALGTIDVALAQRMKNAVGFRNLAVHQYEAMDWQIVHAICTRNLDDFRAFAKAIHS